MAQPAGFHTLQTASVVADGRVRVCVCVCVCVCVRVGVLL